MKDNINMSNNNKTKKILVELYEEDIALLADMWGTKSNQTAIQRSLLDYAVYIGNCNLSPQTDKLLAFRGFVSQFNFTSRFSPEFKKAFVKEYLALTGRGVKKAFAEKKAKELDIAIVTITKWVNRYREDL